MMKKASLIMKNQTLRQVQDNKGFAHIVVLLILVLIATAGFLLWTSTQNIIEKEKPKGENLEALVEDSQPCQIEPMEEKDILECINLEDQNYFIRSMEIRANYPDDSAYKNLIHYLAHPTVQYLDSEGYVHLMPDNYAYYPNPDFYSSIPVESPQFFYRYVKDCVTRETILRTKIDTSLDYHNYIGSDRYEQQCIMDGSMDTYYVESTTKLE
ncbi:MAG: hypothetical protein A3J48_02835 [Candidatus Doudnabacteria bacterium RIFCSPHIGHO2_02_FULL_46_11]|uniref:Uncharacterized protein n=1 Tax=Candidatus Doudnabacteria bacterium RIFCSPHIGHO2_02_FULL_46_11 TaxID=1817832 RepID=A0A1F5P5H7_9BACT|nr:MAG: hypothetical protein A3J48_02835 [Candidatus Doudnabacteria bacterium RIFCSPHIGHO2_02_FULL_46_11]